ncbi:Gfo/Idh/MocA family oxidoreductase [Aurantibacter crassamenti]|uniref:Gfo/Idh/MocA family protein n=1 Tax=Aurantibacter crassamenti TaxID=1837375 RepID=UPI00193A6D06|nr:Gfo/Idh/MocA family oxidoreductase [Aurantibacter crassamenti]MBM1106462.1 Gfo/Idh/MocA family oxidoreductase [Aurantibacter crassamenti]
MKRRQFMIRSGLATVALTTSNLALGQVFKESPNDTLNIGIIGIGNRGTGLIQFINQIPNFNVTACCDIIPTRLEKAIQNVDGSPEAYKDYRKLFDYADVDAILVATPLNSHSKIAIDALAAAKHVYCEKTMAKGYEGISNLIGKVNDSDRIFQTGHQYHSSQLYVQVVELIKSGKIGKIKAFECQYNINGDWRKPVSEPGLERLINWRMYREFSGGLTAGPCSHQIDFVNWVLDAVPQNVIGVGGNDYWKDGREIFDNIHLTYSYPNGVKAKFKCLNCNAKDDYKIKVIGDKGTIILDYEKAWFYPEGKYNKELVNVDGDSNETVNWDEEKDTRIEVTQEDPSKQALIDFRNNVVENKMPTSNVNTGAKTAIAVQMALDAMQKEEIINWNTTLGV